MKVANDAASRNGLSKLHLSLKKAIGEAGATRRSMEEERAADVTLEESVVMAKAEPIEEGKTEVQDSVLEELLDDEDMEL